MASNSGASGWNVEAGTFGTDFEREETLTVCGAASIKVPAGSTERIITTDWTLLGEDDLFRTELDAWTWLRADAIGAAATIQAILQTTDDTQASVLQNAFLLNGALTAANTWEYHGIQRAAVANARWARIKYVFSASNTAVNYIGGYALELNKPRAYGIGYDLPHTLSVGAWSQIPVTSDTENLIDVDASGSNEIHFREPGAHFIAATVPIDEVADGESFDIRVVHNIPSVPATNNHIGSTMFASVATTTDAYLHMSTVVQIGKVGQLGDYLTVEVRQRTGVARDIAAGGLLSLAKVGR